MGRIEHCQGGIEPEITVLQIQLVVREGGGVEAAITVLQIQRTVRAEKMGTRDMLS